jgi:hypothetical protein
MMIMQLVRIIKTIALNIAPLAVGLSLNSCLKDNNTPPLDISRTVPNLVSFQDNGGEAVGGAGYGTTTAPYPLYNFPLNLYNDTAGFAAIVIYGPNGTAPEDITVNLALDTAALTAFNAYNYTNLIYPPDPTTYSFPASVTISKGQTQAYARVTVNGNSNPNPNASYAIPLMITSVSYGSFSSNFGVEINAFSVQ